MLNLKNRKILCLFIFLTSLLLTSWPQAVQAQATRSKEINCRIEIDDAHISTYILKSIGASAVKVDARSTCKSRQERVKLTVEILKTGRFFDHFIIKSSTRPSDVKSSGYVVTNYRTYKFCKNSVSTKYYGVAYSNALIAGKW